MRKYLILLISLFILTSCENNDTAIDDTSPPTITLVGDEIIYVDMWEDFFDVGAFATDDVDEYVEIVSTHEVDTSVSGWYIVEYYAVDSAGNRSETIRRDVCVQLRPPTVEVTQDYYASDEVKVIFDVTDVDGSLTKIAASIRVKGSEEVIEEQLVTWDGIAIFRNLDPGVDYVIDSSFSYDQNNGRGRRKTELESLDVGVYNRLNASYETVLGEELFTPLEAMIRLPYTSYDIAETANIINRLSLIDIEILNALVSENLRIILTNTKITDIKQYRYLEGITPRGWEDTGKTWDDIPGIGGNPVVIKIGESDPGPTHGTINLELHEIAHVIDTYVLGNVSKSAEFLLLQEEERESMFGGNAYYQYSEEYFAETFAYYYLNETTRNKLMEDAPNTFLFMDNLLDHLDVSLIEYYVDSYVQEELN